MLKRFKAQSILQNIPQSNSILFPLELNLIFNRIIITIIKVDFPFFLLFFFPLSLLYRFWNQPPHPTSLQNKKKSDFLIKFTLLVINDFPFFRTLENYLLSHISNWYIQQKVFFFI